MAADLSKAELHRLWDELEAALNALVDGLASMIDDKNASLLRDFIENREYGVALEWLHSIVTERMILVNTLAARSRPERCPLRAQH